MNINIDQALQKIELSKQAIDEAEKILAELLQTQENEVPSVIEEEPPSDPVEMINEVIPVTETTPPRQNLVCYLCESKVFDNRPQKRSGEYKEKSPDFVCSNNTDCSGRKQGQYGMLRKSWWLNSKDLPQDWIKTEVPPAPKEDTVEIDPFDKKSEEDHKDVPF
jgi:hypothetical protein|tara:strand:+ start:771 stop:1262 length:492 start_codon:yes stop_codon:yes gene_type:complete